MNSSHDEPTGKRRVPYAELYSSLVRTGDSRSSCDSAESNVPQEENMSWTYCFDLAFQILTAGFPLASLWRTVIRRSALDHVSNVAYIGFKSSISKLSVEKLARSTTKYFSRALLLGTRRLPYYHDPTGWVPTPHDAHPLRPLVELATSAVVVG